MNYGRYQIIREVGSGSMGVVYQARDPQIDRLVAVKILRQDRTSTETFVRRFLKEAKVIGRLSHPNIVTIYDMGEEQGTIYIAMEFLEGRSLSDVLRESRFDIKEAMTFGIQIAETLNYAHQKGVIHRDIKPSNIIVTPDGRIKITDFGIAHIEDSTTTLQTQAGEIMGTPAYMSPEQILGQPVDGRSDIFSLGVILYEMVTGRRPFGGEGKTLASVFNEITRVTPPVPSTLSAHVPNHLSSLIMKALQKEPEKRFQSGSEISEALKTCLYELGLAAVIKTPAGGKSRSYVIPFAVTLAVAILAGGVYYFYQHTNTSLQRPSVDQQNAQPKKSIASTPMPGPEPVPSTSTPETKQAAPVTPPEMKVPEIPKPEQKSVNRKTPVPKGSKPAQKLAPLTLITTPQGASVYIDENFRGKTPLTLMLSTGEHRVRLTLAGYRDVEREFSLEETMEYPLSFNLQAVQ